MEEHPQTRESLVTAREVANLLGVTASWVYEQSRRGRIPTVTLGRYRRYRVRAIEAWVEGREAPDREMPAGQSALLEATDGDRNVRSVSAGGEHERWPPPENEAMARRSYGTGSLSVRRDARRAESWYGQWWVGQRRVTRKLGLKREQGTRRGLTRSQAERELQRLIDRDLAAPIDRHVTVFEAGERLIDHLSSLGRKRSTLGEYRSFLRVHLGPHFGDRALDAIGPREVEGFIAAKRTEGRATKSILNYLGLLHSIFAYAEKRGLARGNPVKLVDKPQRPSGDPDIRFLDQVELEALLDAVPNDARGPTEHALYLTAAMTGLRQGELLGLRWRDIDWAAARIRVRQNYVRGEFGSPKSRRSSRSVPLADQVAGELERHFQGGAHQGDDDLVFCHPQTGAPLDRSRLLKRFKTAAKRAGIREVRFHDLRHTFGTRMAAAGVALRTLQEWMGHRDFKTTLIYADYQPSPGEAELVDRAFGQGAKRGANLSESGGISGNRKPPHSRQFESG